jgi:amino acid transporter
MGVAGIGPSYSLAATAAVLIGSVGVLAPASLLYCGLIMFGIVFAFRHLNRMEANAGASYSWVTAIFSPAIGFFAGWTVAARPPCLIVPAKKLLFGPRPRRFRLGRKL